jgi:hypothetical protein
MTPDSVEQIANAVLYEGYNLYPYRPSSVKNRQRWTFGGVCPEAYASEQIGEASAIQTQCLLSGSGATVLDVQARFLHLLRRQVGELVSEDASEEPTPVPSFPQASESEGRGERAPAPASAPAFRSVETLHVGDRLLQAWEEAVEREAVAAGLRVGELIEGPRQVAFAFPAWIGVESLPGLNGENAGVFVRRQLPIEGTLEVTAERVRAPISVENEAGWGGPGRDLYRLTARVMNSTPAEDARSWSREEAMLQSLISTHLIMRVSGGEFISAIDPPEELREPVGACCNQGLWPVLAGEASRRDTVLAAPIILYDYPEIAPESPGELFDGTEIDEILTLRIMTLTEEERQAMRGADERTRALLERTDTMPAEQFAKLHGAIRGLRTQDAGRSGAREARTEDRVGEARTPDSGEERK